MRVSILNIKKYFLFLNSLNKIILDAIVLCYPDLQVIFKMYLYKKKWENKFIYTQEVRSINLNKIEYITLITKTSNF